MTQKFKVGDKVKIVDNELVGVARECEGFSGEIKSILSFNGENFLYCILFSNEQKYFFKFKKLQGL